MKKRLDFYIKKAVYLTMIFNQIINNLNKGK